MSGGGQRHRNDVVEVGWPGERDVILREKDEATAFALENADIPDTVVILTPRSLGHGFAAIRTGRGFGHGFM
jgi:hypothetical protein